MANSITPLRPMPTLHPITRKVRRLDLSRLEIHPMMQPAHMPLAEELARLRTREYFRVHMNEWVNRMQAAIDLSIGAIDGTAESIADDVFTFVRRAIDELPDPRERG